MKILNIVRFLPIKGLPAENDITLKIYSDLKEKYDIDSLFVMPTSQIPKWSIHFKKSLKKNFRIINRSKYIDTKYSIEIRFFQSFFPYLKFSKNSILNYYSLIFQYNYYKYNLYKIYKSYEPNIIHAHSIKDAYYAYKLSKKYDISYVITLRGTYSKLYKLQIINNILESSKKLITPSYSLYKKLSKNYPIELLPHGVDKSWFLNENKEFNSSIIRLITVSRLLEMKNIQIIIKAIAILKNSGYNVRYSIVGDGDYKNKLEELVKNTGLINDVKFYGHKSQNEIKQIYKRNDVFIMLSMPETFGRAYFEAAAQGLLIIGAVGTGADGYFNNKQAYFIEPKVDQTCKVLKQINEINFHLKTMQSREKMDSFKNDKIIERYMLILNENCKN